MRGQLVYVSDSDPGISRQRRGRGFSYIAPDGTTIARGAERKRIDAIAVPPAYEDVWICSDINGHWPMRHPLLLFHSNNAPNGQSVPLHSDLTVI
jgi:DNA topoisomerase IB